MPAISSSESMHLKTVSVFKCSDRPWIFTPKAYRMLREIQHYFLNSLRNPFKSISVCWKAVEKSFGLVQFTIILTHLIICLPIYQSENTQKNVRINACKKEYMFIIFISISLKSENFENSDVGDRLDRFGYQASCASISWCHQHK